MDKDAVGLEYVLRITVDSANDPERTTLIEAMKKELKRVASLGYSEHTFTLNHLSKEAVENAKEYFRKEGFRVYTEKHYADYRIETLVIDWRRDET